ncbi:hypothetical protein DPEC_G00183800 [Dallia pectoralis]|uniref:Uncharacterized protein n=1 Tax=Dallia pectoralis TaxID=75939 RepID=A0ACC2GB16_DALPE|nr:hypothetical protein DPEC_G00183800 [Dallia pectoralis]
MIVKTIYMDQIHEYAIVEDTRASQVQKKCPLVSQKLMDLGRRDKERAGRIGPRKEPARHRGGGLGRVTRLQARPVRVNEVLLRAITRESVRDGSDSGGP